MKALCGLLLFGLSTASTAAFADDGAFLRCRSLADSAARLACYDALPVPATAPPAAAPAVTQQQLARDFGLERQQQAATAAALDGIESSLNGPFEGWGPNTRFKLANGQVWQVIDGSSVFADKNSPRVKITRALMGSFFLQVEGMNGAARVKRVE